MTLGCSGTTGTLSTNDRWIQPKPRIFGTDAARLLFRVESRMLRFGQEYRPHITVKTGEGTLQPQLLFKKPWPWVLVGAAAIGAIAGILMLR
jgi:hypothetical protein